MRGLVLILAPGLPTAAMAGVSLMHQDPLPLALARLLYNILHHITLGSTQALSCSWSRDTPHQDGLDATELRVNAVASGLITHYQTKC